MQIHFIKLKVNSKTDKHFSNVFTIKHCTEDKFEKQIK